MGERLGSVLSESGFCTTSGVSGAPGVGANSTILFNRGSPAKFPYEANGDGTLDGSGDVPSAGRRSVGVEGIGGETTGFEPGVTTGETIAFGVLTKRGTNARVGSGTRVKVGTGIAGDFVGDFVLTEGGNRGEGDEDPEEDTAGAEETEPAIEKSMR